MILLLRSLTYSITKNIVFSFDEEKEGMKKEYVNIKGDPDTLEDGLPDEVQLAERRFAADRFL